MTQFSMHEHDRQLVLLALARFGLDRPGFEWAARQAASHFGPDAEEIYDSFRASNADICGEHGRVDRLFEPILGKSDKSN